MPQARTATLAAAFETTDYHVQTGDEWCQVNIGAPCSEHMLRWLREHAIQPCVWLITAHNPQARLCDAAENRRRDAALKTCLDADGYTYVAATSRARDGSWPAEPGVCITDMDEGTARALAVRFGQVALVAILPDGPAQLVWTDAPDADG